MSKDDRILLAHGGGGQLSDQLIREVILPRVGEQEGEALGDSACLTVGSEKVCMTTDSYVVKPLFFNGGNIGKLAVCGTVNDLAVAGAEPMALSLGLIIEEGFATSQLETILESIGETARSCGVSIVTGDTKTVDAGAADGIFINTAGIGRLRYPNLGLDKVQVGDRILVSGTLGDHGMTIMSLRKDIRFQSPLCSDCAPLNGLIAELMEAAPNMRFMRDATRGGVAVTLNEIARGSGYGVIIRETDLPVAPTVRAAADMLGFDVLNIANEGKIVCVVPADQAEQALACCRSHDLGQQARLIGEVVCMPEGETPWVEMETKIGGKRLVQMPYGRELPRIC